MQGTLRRIFSEREFLKLAVSLAVNSALKGGGPFGAAIGDSFGRLLAFSQNSVVQDCDSTSHAEINCIRYLQKKLGTHDLTKLNLTLYSSADPCIQCFGAIYWSGIKKVVTCSTSNNVESICGFKEGPVSKDLWEQALVDKGILFKPGVNSELGKIPLLLYKKLNGRIY